MIDSFCELYEPVYTSKNDTTETVDVVTRNNAKYDAVCLKQVR